MKLIDYRNKLNTHDEYLKILEILRKKCEHIELIIIDGKDKYSNPIVREFKDDIVLVKKDYCGYSTLNDVVYIKATKNFFDYLTRYETFCKYYYAHTKENNDSYDKCENTNFGYDDIVFFDKEGNVLLFTTTHECNISISEKLLD